MGTKALLVTILLGAAIGVAHAQTSVTPGKRAPIQPTPQTGSPPKTLPAIQWPAGHYTQQVNCPPKVSIASLGDGAWSGMKSDRVLLYAYTLEQTTRQVLYCYYQGDGLLFREVPVGSCQPTPTDPPKKSFLCKL